MENVADALKMAAGVLVFVMALGIAISSFSEAKQTADVLIQYNDREYSTQYAKDTGSTNRIVGAETIIPTIYRSYKEKYKIVFYEADGVTPLMLYEQWNYAENKYDQINYIDLENQDALPDDRYKENFIMVLLYGNKAKLKDPNGNVVEDYYDTFINEELNKNTRPALFKFDLNPSGIYDIIEGENFEEKFGVYYQEDVVNSSTDTGNDGTEIDGEYDSSTPEANKNKARVITYTIYNNP